MIVGIGSAAVIGLFGSRFINIWTHGRIHVTMDLVVGMTLAAVLQSLWNSSANMLLAVNRHAMYAYRFIAVSLMMLIAALFSRENVGDARSRSRIHRGRDHHANHRRQGFPTRHEERAYAAQAHLKAALVCGVLGSSIGAVLRLKSGRRGLMAMIAVLLTVHNRARPYTRLPRRPAGRNPRLSVSGFSGR